jgi:hypothetical protein
VAGSGRRLPKSTGVHIPDISVGRLSSKSSFDRTALQAVGIASIRDAET